MRQIFRAVVIVAIAAGIAAARAEQAPEYLVKAEFLERFTRFIDWPSGSEGRGPFLIGVIGNDPFNGFLEQIAAARRIKGRPVEIRRVSDPSQLEGCQVVFICSSERERLRRILGRTESKPVLTVGDTAGFASAGVLINFYTSGETVRFEMNESAIEKSGLKVSSKLLKLARLVEPKGMR